MRENVRVKGRRYAAKGQLTVRELDEQAGTVQAQVRGGGAVWACGRNSSGWFCNCPARGLCSHLEALRLVVALEPREGSA
jgi:hypothetical protein